MSLIHRDHAAIAAFLDDIQRIAQHIDDVRLEMGQVYDAMEDAFQGSGATAFVDAGRLQVNNQLDAILVDLNARRNKALEDDHFNIAMDNRHSTAFD
jgi:hypothetical protein